MTNQLTAPDTLVRIASLRGRLSRRLPSRLVPVAPNDIIPLGMLHEVASDLTTGEERKILRSANHRFYAYVAPGEFRVTHDRSVAARWAIAVQRLARLERLRERAEGDGAA